MEIRAAHSGSLPFLFARFPNLTLEDVHTLSLPVVRAADSAESEHGECELGLLHRDEHRSHMGRAE